MRLIRPYGRRPAAAALLSALAIGGCAGDTSTPPDLLPRVPVAGTVTLDGAPLPEGMIQFSPTQESNATTAAGEIRDGRFAIAKAQGPVPGKYKVTISSHPPVKIQEGEQPGVAPKLKPETVPDRYNTKSTLETDVPAGGSEALSFKLEK
jgi:hypothetical protein